LSEVDVGFGALLGGDRAVRSGHGVVPQHHVVLDHPQPLWFGIPARARGILFALQRCPLRDVSAGALMAGFLVVPQHEPDRSLRLHIGSAEDAGQFHDRCGARAVVIRRLAETASVHYFN